ncbi:hypothetical protein Y032_0458g1831 [Ancylostoma ceylanicum]|uniref:Transthyretin-like family protein n=1 Tax=Ancylostoma ceylanicum TaxID=53326 RepID=A0A016WZY8_9BILA|nr:hypothetical protein Y032_0458g1831 [Ancylostoma ceylanicum]
MKVVILSLLISSCCGGVSDLIPDSIFGYLQSVGVQGKVICNGKPLKNAGLLLYELGTSNTLLNVAVSNEDGAFRLRGTGDGWFRLRTRLEFLHRCNYNGPCAAMTYKNIPSDYAVYGRTDKVVKFFDVVMDVSNTTRKTGGFYDCRFDPSSGKWNEL